MQTIENLKNLMSYVFYFLGTQITQIQQDKHR